MIDESEVEEPTAHPSPAEPEPEPELPPYVIEGARSGRSRCKSCRKTIDKDTLRFGVLVEGPYGLGHMWHHLNCAAKRMAAKVEEAYTMRAWEAGKVPLDASEVPDIAELRKLAEQADQKRKERRELPYAELAPTGRARCKHSGELIEKGAVRIVLGREVEFGNQKRTTPINVLPEYVAEELANPECGTPAEGFAEALRANSAELDAQLLEAAIERIGAV